MGLRKFETWLLLLTFAFYTLFLLSLKYFPFMGLANGDSHFLYSILANKFGLALNPLNALASPAFAVPLFVLVIVLYLNYYVIPNFLETGNISRILVFSLMSFLLLTIINYLSTRIFFSSFFGSRFSGSGGILEFGFMSSSIHLAFILSLFIAFYQFLKGGLRYLFVNEFGNKPLHQLVLKQVTATLAVWLAIYVILYFWPLIPFRWFNSFMLFLVPAYITLFFLLVYKFFPARANGWSKIKTGLITVISFLLLVLPAYILVAKTERLATSRVQYLGLLCIAIFLFVLLPIAYFFYEQQKKKMGEWVQLQTSFTSATANLDFLRSQINPHFLFNALNTIYGTALQENAAKTAEGVQKLGDMMRFMLKENQHEKIALEEEITYLQHYIDLQKLRTEQSPDIDINFTVHEQDCDHQIAPMLLIPFVENAFKHGISLKEKSWIRINLSCDAQHVYFDAYNSIHRKDESDPEKDRSGIGLENVKQRLNLLYPQHHALNIRQTPDEFFVHLTITTR
ncbi:MAG: sensor histidine kinase [Chitinophagaceae bacterium]